MKHTSFLAISLFFSLALGFTSFAIADSEMDAFYKNGKNKSVFEKAKKDGQIKLGKDTMVTACEKSKVKNPKLDCECVKRVVNDTSDEEFFFESMVAIQFYRDSVAAQKAGDKDKLKALQTKQLNREGFQKILATTCGMK